MSVEHLGRWHDRSYGRRADGVVEGEDRLIHVTVREPFEWSPETDMSYVMANGWTAGKNSMRVPAIEAARAGHRSVTVEYTNTGSSEALAANVTDVAEVLDAQQGRRGAMGLSMGGAVVTMACERAGMMPETATLVASGKYLADDYYSSDWRILRQFAEESLEITEIGRNPIVAFCIGATSVSNCLRRPLAVRAEIFELVTGNVHDSLRGIKSRPDAPYVRYVVPRSDRLIPSHAQLDSVKDLPFDEVMACDGGHGRLAYDPLLSREIFARDAKIAAGQVPSGGLSLAA